MGYEERCGFRCACPASPSVSCKAWPDVAEPRTVLLETLPAATSPRPPLPKGPFEHLPRGHLLGVVVVAIEDLPKERLVHGQLTGLAAVPCLGARLGDELTRPPVHAQLVVLDAPGKPAAPSPAAPPARPEPPQVGHPEMRTPSKPPSPWGHFAFCLGRGYGAETPACSQFTWPRPPVCPHGARRGLLLPGTRRSPCWGRRWGAHPQNMRML